MAELKTKKTAHNVHDFIKNIADEQKQKDAFILLELMEKATKLEGKMWGTSIIGVGDIHLKYESGRELDWFIMGFSPRKQNFVLYISGTVVKQSSLLKKLGKYKTGKNCLYINKLEDVDMFVLKELINMSLIK